MRGEQLHVHDAVEVKSAIGRAHVDRAHPSPHGVVVDRDEVGRTAGAAIVEAREQDQHAGRVPEVADVARGDRGELVLRVVEADLEDPTYLRYERVVALE